MGMIGGDRLEGFVFYWFLWSAWIVATFLMNKRSPYRLIIALHSLLVIIFTAFHWSIMNVVINLSVLWILIICMYYLKDYRFFTLLSMMTRVFIVMLSYASYLLFSLYDPVWILFDTFWLEVLLYSILSLIIFDTLLERIVGCTIGFILGEGIFAITITKWTNSYIIGSFHLLDVLSIGILFLLIWNFIINLSVLYDSKLHNFERERHS